MSNDEYVPEEDDVRMAYIEAHVSMADPITRHQRAQAEREAEDAWTAFLARVRRDAWDACYRQIVTAPARGVTVTEKSNPYAPERRVSP